MTGGNHSDRASVCLFVLCVMFSPVLRIVIFAQDVSSKAAVQLHIERSINYYTRGDLPSAIAELHAAQQLAPTDAQVNFMLGNALYRYGDVAGAAEAYGKTVVVQPNHFEAHMSRGFAFFEAGKVDQAVGEWATAKRLELREPFARAALAVGLYASGQVEEARLQYAEAVALNSRYRDPDNLRLDIRWKPRVLNIAKRLVQADR